MLAQNFKTAADLGISKEQKDALCKTLVLLETGKLEHNKKFGGSIVDWSPAFAGKFNMRYWHAQSSCGTIACIGGTAELIGGVHFSDASQPDKLRKLFQPCDIPISKWRDITPSQAATALRSYLTTGNARWDLAVA